MKTQWLSLSLATVLVALSSLGLTSCKSKEPDMGVPNTYQFRDPGNVELKRKLEQKNQNYYNRMDRRSMKRQARDDRYDAWFDMIMQ